MVCLVSICVKTEVFYYNARKEFSDILTHSYTLLLIQ